MLRERWEEATVEFRVARAVLRRAVAMFKQSRFTHRGDALQEEPFSVSEVNAAIGSLRGLDHWCSRFVKDRTELDQTTFACDLARSIREVNDSISALAHIDDELATAFQIEASPVLAKANDMMLYMKRKGLTTLAVPFEKTNDATCDRQKAIEDGTYWSRRDCSDLQHNKASVERLRRFAAFVEDRSPI